MSVCLSVCDVCLSVCDVCVEPTAHTADTQQCFALLEEYDDAISDLLYSRHDEIGKLLFGVWVFARLMVLLHYAQFVVEAGELSLDSHICEAMVGACDFSEAAREARLAAHDEARRVHAEWEVRWALILTLVSLRSHSGITPSQHPSPRFAPHISLLSLETAARGRGGPG